MVYPRECVACGGGGWGVGSGWRVTRGSPGGTSLNLIDCQIKSNSITPVNILEYDPINIFALHREREIFFIM